MSEREIKIKIDGRKLVDVVTNEVMEECPPGTRWEVLPGGVLRFAATPLFPGAPS